MDKTIKEINKQLIAKSRFKRNIDFLRNNSYLATSEFQSGEHSNCHGTLAFLLCIDREIERIWPKQNYRDGNGNYVILPTQSRRPGYIGPEPLDSFLQKSPLIKLKPEEREGEARDGVITFHFENPDSELYGFQLRHSALYLGNERFFGQIKIIRFAHSFTIVLSNMR